MIDPTAQQRRDLLNQLLPRIYQVLDQAEVPAAETGPLRQLLGVIGEQVNLLEDDLERWYDNWFIETCEDWVVPYIGDLVGYESAAPGLNSSAAPESAVNRVVVFPRREVADMIALRRRKGTLAILEELSRRIAGWPARAFEYRKLVSGTAALNYLKPRRSSTVDLRDRRALARLGTAWDKLPRGVDVRRINSRHTRGKFNLPAIALFVYRRKIDSATHVPAHQINATERVTFDVQGFGRALHIRPEPEPSVETLARRINLPLPLTRCVLRSKSQSDAGADPRYYGAEKSLSIRGQWGAVKRLIPAEDIFVKDLSNWDFHPTPEQSHLVAVDPENGRIAFSPQNAPQAVWTTCHYGRPAYLGGGEYDRPQNDVPVWLTVFQYANPGTPGQVASLQEAIRRFNDPATRPDQTHVVIEIVDNGAYSAEFQTTIPQGVTLEIRAANGFRPLLRLPNRTGALSDSCHIWGRAESALVLDGLLFDEGQLLLDLDLRRVQIRHCTLTPGRTRLTIRCRRAEVLIRHCIVGAIVVREPDPRRATDGARATPPALDTLRPLPGLAPVELGIFDSILDPRPIEDGCPASSPPPAAVTGPDDWANARLWIVRSTSFGTVLARLVHLICNSIFCEPLRVQNCLEGCVRFSYLREKSCTPPQFHCQPAQAIERAAAADRGADSGAPTNAALIAPSFVSTRFTHPDYGRLADDCAVEILRGADDEGEMGVYHDEFFTQRGLHLRTRLQEFIPAGSDADLVFGS